MDSQVQSASSNIITSDLFYKSSDCWHTLDPCQFSFNARFPQRNRKQAEWIHLSLQHRRDQNFLDNFFNSHNALPREFPQNASLQVLINLNFCAVFHFFIAVFKYVQTI